MIARSYSAGRWDPTERSPGTCLFQPVSGLAAGKLPWGRTHSIQTRRMPNRRRSWLSLHAVESSEVVRDSFDFEVKVHWLEKYSRKVTSWWYLCWTVQVCIAVEVCKASTHSAILWYAHIRIWDRSFRLQPNWPSMLLSADFMTTKHVERDYPLPRVCSIHRQAFAIYGSSTARMWAPKVVQNSTQ